MKLCYFASLIFCCMPFSECLVYATSDCIVIVLLARLDLLIRPDVGDFAICVSPLQSF
jgi:hypothetical protein